MMRRPSTEENLTHLAKPKLLVIGKRSITRVLEAAPPS